MTGTEHRVPVLTPYRLDLTVAVLRRFSTNVVDVADPGGTYYRALGGETGPTLVAVRQSDAASLYVRIEGAGDELRTLASVRRTLATDRSLATFDRGAVRIAWLRALAQRMRGVKPPRYPTLWEACVNAIVFQHVSVLAAGAILRRTIESLGAPVRFRGVALHAFPACETFLAADDALLRSSGLSAAKVATLRRVAHAVRDGELAEAHLERLTTPEAAAALCAIKGIGPWTAAVVLLRGLGRLDVFPAGDSGVARSIASLGGSAADVPAALARLGDERGMLYYHLLLARLEARGDL